MRKVTLAIIGLCLSCLAAAPAGHSSDLPRPTHDPIQAALRRLQPRLKGPRASALARDFRNAALACGQPWQLLVSIAYHESSLGFARVNSRTGDFGLMQINSKTGLHYDIAQATLVKDDALSLAVACRVLSENKARFGSKVPYWIGLYRSGTRLASAGIRDNAKRYDRMVRATAAQIGYQNGWHPENYQQ